MSSVVRGATSSIISRETSPGRTGSARNGRRPSRIKRVRRAFETFESTGRTVSRVWPARRHLDDIPCISEYQWYKDIKPFWSIYCARFPINSRCKKLVKYSIDRDECNMFIYYWFNVNCIKIKLIQTSIIYFIYNILFIYLFFYLDTYKIF